MVLCLLDVDVDVGGGNHQAVNRKCIAKQLDCVSAWELFDGVSLFAESKTSLVVRIEQGYGKSFHPCAAPD